MQRILCSAAVMIFALALPQSLVAQYWGERVLEKGFEHTDFFFVPGNLIPYGIGSFKSTTPGLIDDPLLNLAVNPARVSIDSIHDHYLYADFRNARIIQDQGPGYIVPWRVYTASDAAIRPYPWVYLNTRKELEPVFSGAYVGRPLPETVPGLMVGTSYQLILQDSKYYSVPQDIYRSVVGSDFSGTRAAAAGSIPIVDRFSGQDNMHQQGHLVTVFGRYEVSSLGTVGLKVGRVTFDRSGMFGSSNLWGYPAQNSGTSLWSNTEARDQAYGHWELTGGAEFRLGKHTSIGVTAGSLWGDAMQNLHRNDSSYYDYSAGADRSYYVRSASNQETWRHDGRSLLLGGDVVSHISPQNTVRLVYQHQRTTVDIGVNAAIIDTSFSTYSYLAPSPVTSTSYAMLTDLRGGSGESKTTCNRLLAAMQWRIDDRMDLTFGVQVDWQTTETSTQEIVLARMQSVYQSTQGDYSWIYGNDESKDLLWTFKAERSSFRIPIILTIRASDVFDVLLGLNRTMTHSTIDDVTLALFRYRQVNEVGAVTRQENFGERYTTPQEKVSDVQTTFLAGLTAAPTRQFQVRFLVVPNFRDTYDGSELDELQWWIGVSLTP
jgi:hypothetical protein